MENLQAQDIGPVDQIGQVCLPLPFGLADAFQFVSNFKLSLVALKLTTDMMHTLASKVLQTPLFKTMEWSSSDIQITKVFHIVSRILEGKYPRPL